MRTLLEVNTGAHVYSWSCPCVVSWRCGLVAGLHTDAERIFPRNPTALCDIQNKRSERVSD